MYSRKNSGYTPTVPPPGYNGVTFNRNYQPSSSIPPARRREDGAPAPDFGASHTPEDGAPDVEETRDADDIENTGDSVTDTVQEPEERAAPERDILKDIASKEFRIEDLLTIGAVLLFVSGELDGDIMLLLGLLLVAGI